LSGASCNHIPSSSFIGVLVLGPDHHGGFLKVRSFFPLFFMHPFFLLFSGFPPQRFFFKPFPFFPFLNRIPGSNDWRRLFSRPKFFR